MQTTTTVTNCEQLPKVCYTHKDMMLNCNAKRNHGFTTTHLQRRYRSDSSTLLMVFGAVHGKSPQKHVILLHAPPDLRVALLRPGVPIRSGSSAASRQSPTPVCDRPGHRTAPPLNWRKTGAEFGSARCDEFL